MFLRCSSLKFSQACVKAFTAGLTCVVYGWQLLCHIKAFLNIYALPVIGSVIFLLLIHFHLKGFPKSNLPNTFASLLHSC